MKTPVLFDSSGRRLDLGGRVGKGGEGEVFAIASNPNLLVKRYTMTDLRSREAKINDMIRAGLANRSPLIAFPISAVRDHSGSFAGFTMTRISEHQPLHELYSPGARKSAFPRADYRFLVRAATNIARAVGAAHAADCVIGDINHSGILVSDKATAALIDADSFQVVQGSLRYFCTVGVPEYTPPELQGRKLDGLVRTPNHDAFGLAIVIFQLLWMGRHPFAGKFSGGDMPIEKAIIEHRFAYSRLRKVGMDMPPAVPSLNEFPLQVALAFENAFGADPVRPRPTAKQWIDLLATLESELKVCAANSLHHYPPQSAECPWCRMERLQGVQLFVPKTASLAEIPSFGKADVGAIWRVIEGITITAGNNLQPVLNTPNVEVSAEAHAEKEPDWQNVGIGVLLLILAVGVLVSVPQLWPVWMGAGGFGIAKLISGPKKQKSRVLLNAIDIEQRWIAAVEDWRRRSSEPDIAQIKNALTELKRQIDSLPQEEKRRIDEYGSNRRNEHLKAHLDRFRIRSFRIAGIGPAKLATLTSYGIETAADVTFPAVSRVPGFGPTISNQLVAWRQKLERQYPYNPDPTQADRLALLQIKAEIARRSQELKTQLSKGAENFRRAGQDIIRRRAAIDPQLQRLHEQRHQAAVDLKYLGLTLPTTHRPAARSPGPLAVRPTPTVRTTVASNNCPRCGGGMVVRRARRGRNAGHLFYGCSRYPKCTGTRAHP